MVVHKYGIHGATRCPYCAESTLQVYVVNIDLDTAMVRVDFYCLQCHGEDMRELPFSNYVQTLVSQLPQSQAEDFIMGW